MSKQSQTSLPISIPHTTAQGGDNYVDPSDYPRNPDYLEIAVLITKGYPNDPSRYVERVSTKEGPNCGRVYILFDDVWCCWKGDEKKSLLFNKDLHHKSTLRRERMVQSESR